MRVFVYGFKIKSEDVLRFLKINYEKYDVNNDWYDQLNDYFGENINFDKYFYTEYYDIYFGVIKELKDDSNNELDIENIISKYEKILFNKKFNSLFTFLFSRKRKKKIYILNSYNSH